MPHTFSPEPSFDSQALLDSAEMWRTAARTEIARGDWAKAEAALGMAETTYESAQRVVGSGSSALERKLAEGRALCIVLRSDIELRHWRLPSAEKRLDEAYQAFKRVEDGVIGAELYRVTARLAERQGRWQSARAAWKRVVRLTDGEDEVALGDALIRLAEVEVVIGNDSGANAVLERVESLVRELDDGLLRARAAAVRAADLESRKMYAAAWEAWHDAQMSTTVAPVDFAGLLKLRMAGTAVWMNPRQGFRLIENGYEDLVSANHPDAKGLAYHQVAVLALAVRDADAAALACVGSRRCRGGFDDTSRPMLVQALRQGGHTDAADELEAEEGARSEASEGVLETALNAAAEERGLKWSQVGTEEGLLALCAALRRRDGVRVQIRVEGETGWLVEDNAALVRHRATLTWDAPVDTLGTVEPPRPVVAPTPRPAPRRMEEPEPDGGEPTLPPDRYADAVVVTQSSVVSVLLAVFAVLLFVAGGLSLAMLVLVRFVLPNL